MSDNLEHLSIKALLGEIWELVEPFLKYPRYNTVKKRLDELQRRNEQYWCNTKGKEDNSHKWEFFKALISQYFIGFKVYDDLNSLEKIYIQQGIAKLIEKHWRVKE